MAVPVIARQALRDIVVASCPMAKGTTIDCRMRSLDTGESADHLRFFGAGAHMRLGRRRTLALFARAAAGVTTRLAGVEITLRRDDIFAIPETIWVTVQDLAFDTPDIDSLSLLKIVMQLEDALGVELDICLSGQRPQDVQHLFTAGPVPTAFDAACTCRDGAGVQPIVFAHAAAHVDDALTSPVDAGLPQRLSCAAQGLPVQA
jgi:hypothetical protein